MYICRITILCNQKMYGTNNIKALLFLTTPHSPDLASADYFIFPKVKSNLKGRRFNTISDIQNNVTSELKTIPAAEFYWGIQKLHDVPIRV